MTDTMLFGVLKMPFEMAMKDEISRIQFYARVQELVGRFEAQQQAEPVADGDKVICPACCHQFRGIPETVQTLMLHAGFEPPFTTPPQRKELSEIQILDMMPSTIPADYDGPLMEFARAVEAKLKERNGY